jgi:hypothetical protein
MHARDFLMQPQCVYAASQLRSACKLSFDFTQLWGRLCIGQTQVALPSVKGAAASTPRNKNWTITCRATQFCKDLLVWDAAGNSCARAHAGLRLQARPVCARSARAIRQGHCAGRDWAKAQPALFPIKHLRAAPLCDTPISTMGASYALRQRVWIC